MFPIDFQFLALTTDASSEQSWQEEEVQAAKQDDRS